MEIEKQLNIKMHNPATKTFLADAYFPASTNNLPLVIFAHGYKGFKDWGAWHLVAEAFAKAGFYFVKFNFSHNGTTIDDPLNFADPDAFGENNYLKELLDLEFVFEYFKNQPQVDASNIALIGHSRGGGIVLVSAGENESVTKVSTWNGIHDFNSLFPNPQLFEKWEKDGVFYIENKRTGQKLPHFFQFYTNYKEHEARLSVQHAAQQLTKPNLIIQGITDDVIKPNVPQLLHSWIANSKVEMIENGDHTLGASHPWTDEEMPLPLQQACELTIRFFKQGTVSS